MARPPLVLETWGKIRRGTKNGIPYAVANYRDSDGVTRPVMRTGPTEPQAERILLQALKERQRVAASDLSPSSTVRQLGAKWMQETEERTDLAPGSVNVYRKNLTTHIYRGLGDVRLNEASVPRLDRFIKTVSAKHGRGAARLCRVVLSGMFGLAVRHGAVPTNPVRDVATVSRKRQPVVAPAPEDVPRIRTLFETWDAGTDGRGAPRTTDLLDVVDMFIGSGIRTGEAFALQWDDVDLTSTPATVTVHRTIANDLDGRMHVQEYPKTHTSNRVLKLPPHVAQILVRRRVNSISDFVFPSTRGTFRSPNNFRRQWRSVLVGTEFEGVTPKSFRKGVATLLRNTMGTGAAKDQLGHSSEKITEAHYIQAALEGPDATEVLESLFA